jgi:hypothetical protein
MGCEAWRSRGRPAAAGKRPLTGAAPDGRTMLWLDHLSVIAPSLAEGVSHVRECLDLDIPFGQRHDYMGTYNHLLQLGNSVYLEIVAVDPEGRRPGRARWFGLDDVGTVRAAWDEGRRLRGWVARADDIAAVLSGREAIFGKQVALPFDNPSFDFSLQDDGSLPLGGAAPSIIDRRGKPRSMATMPDLGARLASFALEHPDSASVANLYRQLNVDRPPTIATGPSLRYQAKIETAAGLKVLT